MWNDGKQIVWDHIMTLYRDDSKRSLKWIPKLTDENVFLSSYSVMNVRIAAQVLSMTCGKVLYAKYPEKFHGTAEFCLKMNKFFDCLTVRHQDEYVNTNNRNVRPYTTIDDDRLTWLTGDFLNYFKEWKESIENCEFASNLSDEDKQFMFIADKTYEGLQITCNSISEIVKYLLTTGGMKFVLTEKFNQDVLEEYFGRQRSLGRRNDNPTMFQLSYQANVIRIQRCIVPVKGNTEGRHRGKRVRSWSIVDNEPLDKRKTERKSKKERKRASKQ